MAVKNSLTNNQQAVGPVSTRFVDYLARADVQDQIAAMIGEDKRELKKFIAELMVTYQANPTLKEKDCDKGSIISAVYFGRSLELPPSPQLGYYYIVPYFNKKRQRYEAQFQLGYKGYTQLAIRSGYYKKIVVEPIKEGELTSWNLFEEDIELNVIEDDTLREETPTIGYYAMLELSNGFRKVLYWSKEKMEKHAEKYSNFSIRAKEKLEKGEIPQKELYKFSSHWYTGFNEMAKKTMLRQIISKWGIMSVELQSAFSSDMGVINGDGSITYVDNENRTIDTEKSVVHELETETLQDVAYESEKEIKKKVVEVVNPDDAEVIEPEKVSDDDWFVQHTQ